MIVKICSAMDYCKDMTDYIEAKIACNGEDCSEKSCAPGMRCSGGKCTPHPNYGWSFVASLYHECCGEETDEVCKDGKIWIAQYQSDSNPNDIDGDGLPNKYEQDAPPIKKSDPTKADTDSDGINDKEDNCPNVYNPDQKSTHTELCSIGKVYAVPDHFDVPIKEGDTVIHIEVDETTYCMEWDGKFGEKVCEGDKISLPKYCKHLHLAGDACGTDDDGDGLWNIVEIEADDAHKSNPAKSDTDGDGVGDKEDNCRQDYNSDQKDTDKDALGDACDSDDDNDNVVDMWEMYYGCNPADKSSWPSIKDTCKYCDRYPCGESYIIWSEDDMDQDGMLNATDGDLDGDDIPNDQDDDMDGDGIPNANDNCIYSYNPDQADTDTFLNSFGNPSGDACDDDDDNDFISDKDEINGGCDPKNDESQPKYPGTCSGMKSQ